MHFPLGVRQSVLDMSERPGFQPPLTKVQTLLHQSVMTARVSAFPPYSSQIPLYGHIMLMGAHSVKNSVHMKQPLQSKVLYADRVHFSSQKQCTMVAKHISMQSRGEKSCPHFLTDQFTTSLVFSTDTFTHSQNLAEHLKNPCWSFYYIWPMYIYQK
jgi:hypothetical protein